MARPVARDQGGLAGPSGATKGLAGTAAVAAAVLSILGAVYADEGGYVNDPNDPGGATNYGVTERVARANGYRGNMRDFPMHCSEAAAVCADDIYARQYLERPGYLPLVPIEPAVADELVNTTVNMGPDRPSRWFQLSLREFAGVSIAVDGKIGRQSIAGYQMLQRQRGKVAACVAMLDKLDAYQRDEYDRLVRRNPKLKKFHKGWIRHRIGNVDRRQCGKGWA